MIRLMGLVGLPPVNKLTSEAEQKKEALVGGQKKLDVDKDGKIEADDLAKLRAKKNNETVNEDANDGEDPSNVGDHEGYMSRAQLMSVHKQAGELYNMIGEQEGLEAWVQDKIGKAADYINSVYNYLQYEKNKANSLGNGDGSPADPSMPMDKEV